MQNGLYALWPYYYASRIKISQKRNHTKEFLFSHNEVAPFLIKHKIALFTPFQYLIQMHQTTIKLVTYQKEIVHKYLNSVLYHIWKYRHNAMLEGLLSIMQPKWHLFEGESPIRTSKGSVLFVFQSNGDSIVAWITIKNIILTLTTKAIRYLIYERHRKMVSFCQSIL